MIDPRRFFAAQNAAYALPAAFPGVPAVDTILGPDLNGIIPQAIVTADAVAFHGTFDLDELFEDLNDVPWGDMAEGIAQTYNGLRTSSGAPLSTYANRKVIGHSRGANLAAKWAQMFASPLYCLFAYPKLCGADVVGDLTVLNGDIFNLDGDPVADLWTGWPAAKNVTQVKAIGYSIDPIFYHRFSTYEASLNRFCEPLFPPSAADQEPSSPQPTP